MIINPLRQSSTSVYLSIQILIFIIYFVIGKASLLLALPGTNVSPFWPASGFALACTFLLGYEVLISIFFASAFMNLDIFFKITSSQDPEGLIVIASLLTGIGAALQAAVGAFLIKKFILNPQIFTNAWNSIKFFFFSLLSALVNSNIGTYAFWFLGLMLEGNYSNFMWTWFIGDSAGIFTTAPLIVILLKKNLRWFPKKLLEFVLLIVVIFFISYLQMTEYQLTYLYLPCLLWGAVRFGLIGAAICNCLISIILIYFTTQGMGPFLTEHLYNTLLLLTGFIIVVSASFITFAAYLEERESNLNAPQWQSSPMTFSRLFSRLKAFFRFRGPRI